MIALAMQRIVTTKRLLAGIAGSLKVVTLEPRLHTLPPLVRGGRGLKRKDNPDAPTKRLLAGIDG